MTDTGFDDNNLLPPIQQSYKPEM